MGIHEPEVCYLRAEDGVRLAVHRLGPPDGVPVVLVPGTFSNHTFWLGTRGTGFARALGAAGFEAWALDPRGHGLSDRPARKDRWHFDHWARRDVPAAVLAAAAEGRPPVLVGHSAGGSAALAALAADPDLAAVVRGLALLATPAPWLQPFRRVFARTVRFSAALCGRFPARLLGLGPEDELPGVMTQWMGWNLDGSWIGDDGTDYGALLARMETPTLAVAAAGDHLWAPPNACRGLHDLLGAPDKTYLLCGRHTGFSTDFDHVGLVVSRAAQAEVWPSVIDWIQARAPAGAAPVRP